MMVFFIYPFLLISDFLDCLYKLDYTMTRMNMLPGHDQALKQEFQILQQEVRAKFLKLALQAKRTPMTEEEKAEFIRDNADEWS